MAEPTKPPLGPNAPRAGVGKVGQATEMDFNTYRTSGLVYPDDLLSPNGPYGGNYVIFYLNVHEDSKVIGDSGSLDGGKVIDDPTKVLPRMSGNVADANLSKATMGVMAAGAGAIAANAAGVAQRVGGIAGTPLSKAGAAVANTIGGGAAGGIIAANTGASKKTKRMQRAIALHVPTDLSIRYGMQWGEEDMAGALAMAMALESTIPAMAAATAAGGVVGALTKSKRKAGAAAGAAGLITGALTGGLGKAAGALGGYATGLALNTPGIGPLLSKASGVAANPKKEQLFKSVDFRTFTFSYQFFPRDSAEANNVIAIIKEFKLHMHPEYKDNAQFLYIVPSEFDIYYYHNGKENLNLHRHTSCVLTDMSISYAPQGVFATFSDGMPTQINIQMTFKELATLTKETIQDRY